MSPCCSPNFAHGTLLTGYFRSGPFKTCASTMLYSLPSLLFPFHLFLCSLSRASSLFPLLSLPLCLLLCPLVLLCRVPRAEGASVLAEITTYYTVLYEILNTRIPRTDFSLQAGELKTSLLQWRGTRGSCEVQLAAGEMGCTGELKSADFSPRKERCADSLSFIP